MTSGAGLRGYLLDDVSIAGIVGAQVYSGRLPQKPDLSDGKGALLLTLISSPGDHHLRGTGLVRERWQVDSWAKTHDQADALGRLCRVRLDGFTGSWTNMASPPETLLVQAVLKADESEHVEIDILGGLYRHTADYWVIVHSGASMVA